MCCPLPYFSTVPTAISRILSKQLAINHTILSNQMTVHHRHRTGSGGAVGCIYSCWFHLSSLVGIGLPVLLWDDIGLVDGSANGPCRGWFVMLPSSNRGDIDNGRAGRDPGVVASRVGSRFPPNVSHTSENPINPGPGNCSAWVWMGDILPVAA